ncbi:LysM domain/BON superfamily protein [compost metagenome]
MAGYQFEYENRYQEGTLQQLDNLQHDPNKMVVVDFKQDYTVLIRKKLYYAVNQNNNENYIKVFQINNFISLRTSTSVYGKGSASITMKGGERVIVADKSDVNKRDWENFDEILYGWNNIDNEGGNGSWRKFKDPSDPNGAYVDYGNLMKVREQKYGWALAEKCDFEPMDEVYIFGKSKREKNTDGSYKFSQIFFGYVGAVTKNYTAGTGGSIITIEVKDHLKLMEISRIANRPALDMRVVVPGSRLDGNGFWIIEDDYRYNGVDPDSLLPLSSGTSFIFTNMFAGKRADDIIKQLCIESGIPHSKLKTRIEPTERTPFAIQFRDNVAELFAGDFKLRSEFAQQAASIMNFEFFADEEGNIVWKIPSYNVGINRLPKNNLGYNFSYLYDVGGALHQSGTTTVVETKNVEKTRKVTVTTENPITYTVKKGDTLWAIAKTYLGNASKWPQIYQDNKSKIKDPHWIYPGQVFIIKKSGTATKTEKYTEKVQVKKQVESEQNNTSISAITDDKIPVVYPWEIIQFTFRDSDEQIYTAAEVTAEVPYIGPSVSGVVSAVKRAVSDPLLIAKYGVRVAPSVTSPLIGGAAGAELYANMLIVKSISNRYTGQLQMIEESSIKVGDPIRFHLYDQHPFPEIRQGNDDMNSEQNAQAIFYVDQIDRTIQVSGVSTMSLSLKAGRVLEQPSLYDKCVNLYRPFYEKDAQTATAATSSSGGAKTPVVYATYTVKKGDNLWKIASGRYGSTGITKKVNEIMSINKMTTDRIYPGQVLKMP